MAERRAAISPNLQESLSTAGAIFEQERGRARFSLFDKLGQLKKTKIYQFLSDNIVNIAVGAAVKGSARVLWGLSGFAGMPITIAAGATSGMLMELWREYRYQSQLMHNTSNKWLTENGGDTKLNRAYLKSQWRETAGQRRRKYFLAALKGMAKGGIAAFGGGLLFDGAVWAADLIKETALGETVISQARGLSTNILSQFDIKAFLSKEATHAVVNSAATTKEVAATTLSPVPSESVISQSFPNLDPLVDYNSYTSSFAPPPGLIDSPFLDNQTFFLGATQPSPETPFGLPVASSLDSIMSALPNHATLTDGDSIWSVSKEVALKAGIIIDSQNGDAFNDFVKTVASEHHVASKGLLVGINGSGLPLPGYKLDTSMQIGEVLDFTKPKIQDALKRLAEVSIKK